MQAQEKQLPMTFKKIPNIVHKPPSFKFIQNSSSKNSATSKINSGQPRMSFETLNISNESTNLALTPVKTVFKNSN